MKSTARCFVLTDDGYEEITYAALEERRVSDPTYADKRFIGLQGMLKLIYQLLNRVHERSVFSNGRKVR